MSNEAIEILSNLIVNPKTGVVRYKRKKATYYSASLAVSLFKRDMKKALLKEVK